PALSLFAQTMRDGRAYIVEKDFGEHGLAVEALDRSDSDARRIKLEKDQREALMLLAARRAKKPERPVRIDRTRRPNLVAAEDVVVAVARSRRSHSSQIAAGLRLRPGLRPDLVARGHRRQKARLLLIGAVFHQRRAKQENAVLVDPRGSLGAII